MDKNTKILIKNIINNEELYILTPKSKLKLKEIQNIYNKLTILINNNMSKDMINKELMNLVEKQNDFFANRTDEIVTFTINYIKNQKL